MTMQKRAGITAASIAGVIASIGLAFKLWPDIQPVADWLMANAGMILGREQVQAVMVASAIGAFVNVSLPYALPGCWRAGLVRGVSGWAAFFLTLAAAWTLVPTRTGFVYAMLAASATPTLADVVTGFLYWCRPAAKPNSLR